MTRHHKLVVEAVHTELHRIRSFVEESSQRCGAAQDVGVRLALAADEVCSNIIDHSGSDGPIELVLSHDGLVTQLTVTDEGEAFDPRTIAPIDIGAGHERPIGGLGWHLVVQSVDRIGYRRLPGRNELRLIVDDSD